MNKRLGSSAAVLVLIVGVLTQAGAASPAAPASGLAVQPLADSSAAKPVPAYMQYQFYGDRYRDPFVPLIGDVTRGNEQMYDRPPAIAALVLKGIVQDSQGRMALLSGGASSYILR